jgi:hypothetical protein
VTAGSSAVGHNGTYERNELPVALFTGVQSVVKGPLFPLIGSDTGKAKCRMRSLAASFGASRERSQR